MCDTVGICPSAPRRPCGLFGFSFLENTSSPNQCLTRLILLTRTEPVVRES